MGKVNNKGQDEFRTAVTLTVVWVAGLTLIVIFSALLAGIWLDKNFNSKPILTVTFILISIPVTLLMTFRVVKRVTARIQPDKQNEVSKEEPQLGEER
jgi:F0F1-type ATP synthase assembly protein I